MTGFFDLEAVKSWYDNSAQLLSGTPILIKVRYDHKSGGKVTSGLMPNFIKEDVPTQSADENGYLAAVEKYNFASGWFFIMQTLNALSISNATNVIITIHSTASGPERTKLPVVLKQQQQSNQYNQNVPAHLQQLQGTNLNQSPIIGSMLQQQQQPQDIESRIENAVLKLERKYVEKEKDREIEEWKAAFESSQDEKLGLLGKIGAIAENNPDFANIVIGGVERMLMPIISAIIGGTQGTQTAIGTIDNDGNSVSEAVIFQGIEKLFPNQSAKETLILLINMLSKNEMYLNLVKQEIKKFKDAA